VGAESLDVQRGIGGDVYRRIGEDMVFRLCAYSRVSKLLAEAVFVGRKAALSLSFQR
jgi:hypothetical protein